MNDTFMGRHDANARRLDADFPLLGSTVYLRTQAIQTHDASRVAACRCLTLFQDQSTELVLGG
jgi:hypothetical protein